eukprot:GHRQ01025116.1.p1 GENE.GHRQ01025116.1~~GHRQ01025116.1.p1  ORF type:complete len:113 (-),score=11.92 GHRQ01025116.1:522-860(-)
MLPGQKQAGCVRTLSAVLFCRTVMFAVPTSPLVLNLTPSLLALITTARRVTAGVSRGGRSEVSAQFQHSRAIRRAKRQFEQSKHLPACQQQSASGQAICMPVTASAHIQYLD